MPLVSNIEHRSHDVVEADFDVFEKFDFVESYFSVTSGFLQTWNRDVPIMPEDFLNILLSYREPYTSIHLSGQKKYLSFEFGSVALGKSFFQCEYDFVQEPKLESLNVEIPLDQRGKKIGPRLVAMAIDLNVAFGMEELPLWASLQSGAKIWSKAGFTKDPNREMMNRRLPKILAAKLEALHHIIPNDVYEDVAQYVAWENDDDLCKLAEIDFDLTPYVRRERDKAILFSSLETALSDVFNMKTEHGIACRIGSNVIAALSNAEKHGRPLTLVDYLLSEESAFLRADFSNDNQIGQVIENLGGVQHSHIAPVHH